MWSVSKLNSANASTAGLFAPVRESEPIYNDEEQEEKQSLTHEKQQSLKVCFDKSKMLLTHSYNRE